MMNRNFKLWPSINVVELFSVKNTKYISRDTVVPLAKYCKNYMLYIFIPADKTTIRRRKVSFFFWIGTNEWFWRHVIARNEGDEYKEYGMCAWNISIILFPRSHVFFTRVFHRHISYGNNPWERNRYALHVSLRFVYEKWINDAD